MNFVLIPKSVTLNDFERSSGRYFRYFSEIGSIRGALRHCVKVAEDIPKRSGTEM